MTGKSTDVVIIGGGIAGASTAYRLAEKGLRVILLERDRVGEQASGRAGGGVRQQNRHPSELPLAMAAVEIWTQIADELECDVDYRRFGNLRLLSTREELETYAQITAREQEMGLSVEIISPSELRNSNFFLAAGFSGHAFCLGPVVGKLMAEWIADGRSSMDLSGFSWSRFESLRH